MSSTTNINRENEASTTISSLSCRNKALSAFLDENNHHMTPFDPWSMSAEITSLTSSIDSKASPYVLKSWTLLSQTLDGRDKITKIIQYTSRFLGYYYEVLLLNQIKYHTSDVVLASTTWMEKARKFRNLQKALMQSRKAYRFGKSLVELQKLKEMGLFQRTAFYCRRFIFCDGRVGGAKVEVRSQHHPPVWKIISRIFRVVGLAGFWLGDNVSFLYSTGFWLDYENSNVIIGTRKEIILADGRKSSNGMKERASLFATRSYFFASLAALYLNAREWLCHRNGPLQQVIQDVSDLDMHESLQTDNNHNNAVVVENRERQEALFFHYEEVKRKHFTLFLALVKSCCDVTVFSNNLDLYRKFRGKKMNEGIHCICSIISALTVLYNNYPSKIKESSIKNIT